MNKPRPEKQEPKDAEIEYLSNKMNSFNSKQLITFIDNFYKLDDPTISEKEQDKAYDKLMALFYGKDKKGE